MRSPAPVGVRRGRSGGAAPIGSRTCTEHSMARQRSIATGTVQCAESRPVSATQKLAPSTPCRSVLPSLGCSIWLFDLCRQRRGWRNPCRNTGGRHVWHGLSGSKCQHPGLSDEWKHDTGQDYSNWPDRSVFHRRRDKQSARDCGSGGKLQPARPLQPLRRRNDLGTSDCEQRRGTAAHNRSPVDRNRLDSNHANTVRHRSVMRN